MKSWDLLRRLWPIPEVLCHSTASFKVEPGWEDVDRAPDLLKPQLFHSWPHILWQTACIQHFPAFPMRLRTGSATCSGATFSCPLTWYMQGLFKILLFIRQDVIEAMPERMNTFFTLGRALAF